LTSTWESVIRWPTTQAMPRQGTIASVSDVTDDSGIDSAKRALRSMVNAVSTRHPLVLGLVAPLGTPLSRVEAGLAKSLERYSYKVEPIHLARLLDTIGDAPWNPLPTERSFGYYDKRMSAGNLLREVSGSGAALAVLAVGRISDSRRENAEQAVVYLLKSLKHPDEVRLLRRVYGDTFWLLGASSPSEELRDDLSKALGGQAGVRAQAELLIERDEAERISSKLGQNVRDTFAESDLFVEVRRGSDPRTEIDRLVDALFGSPFLTPTLEEEAMKFASDASVRSASLGRQVGAALIPAIGTPIVVGTNEVPKPGGGQYWHGDEPDFRDFRLGEDSNPVFIRHLVEEILLRLKETGVLTDSYSIKTPSEMYDELAITVLEGSRVKALIEFIRCVHAEQAAIINAARSGVSTQGATLYSTTFPCHECTKMIIAAGITEVVFIEPYSKSLATNLYSDLVESEPPAVRSIGLVNGKVPFRVFVGIAPSRYQQTFEAGTRKIGDKVVGFNSDAHPRTTTWDAKAIERREDTAIAAMRKILDEVVWPTVDIDRASDLSSAPVEDLSAPTA
jgi:deoxycytidylate deaminase